MPASKATSAEPAPRNRKSPVDPAKLILDLALIHATRNGWDTVSLKSIGNEAGLTLAEVYRHYPDLDAIANAWFAHALAHMLAAPPDGFDQMPVRDRLELLMRRWFDALSPHQGVTAQMIQAKLWVAHPHHYVPMVFDLSRLIQTWRDAAGMTGQGRQRQIEEIGLTNLFLAVLAVWCRDRSANQERSMSLLAKGLDQADSLAARLFR